jgi:hypothetical protein
MLVAKFSILLQALVDDSFQLIGNIRVQPHWGDRSFAQDRFQYFRHTVSAKWQGARCPFVEHHPK